jgi:hypothetical protein
MIGQGLDEPGVPRLFASLDGRWTCVAGASLLASYVERTSSMSRLASTTPSPFRNATTGGQAVAQLAPVVVADSASAATATACRRTRLDPGWPARTGRWRSFSLAVGSRKLY